LYFPVIPAFIEQIGFAIFILNVNLLMAEIIHSK